MLPPEISSSWSSGGGWPRCSQLGGLYFFRVTYCRPMVFLAFFTRFRDRVLERVCTQGQQRRAGRTRGTGTRGGVGVPALGPSSILEGRALVLGGAGWPAGRMRGAQGEGEGAPDVRRVPQLVQLLSEELGAVGPHLLVKGHPQQLCQTRGPQRSGHPWVWPQPQRPAGKSGGPPGAWQGASSQAVVGMHRALLTPRVTSRLRHLVLHQVSRALV